MGPPLDNLSAANLLRTIQLGSEVAEHDEVLAYARVETSTFSYLMSDKVDIVPGSKGSGKTALFRLFSEVLPDYLLENRKVVVAHGVEERGQVVWETYRAQLEGFSEAEFVDFWCAYFISLARDSFIREERFSAYFEDTAAELQRVKDALQSSGVPDFEDGRGLGRVLEACAAFVRKLFPKKATLLGPDGTQVSFDFAHDESEVERDEDAEQAAVLPRRLQDLILALEELLKASGLHLWLMVDRLDELFLRRSHLERTALRALLRTKRYFDGRHLRLKIFIRDDMLDEISEGGFPALTHVVARMADPLEWSEEQILDLIVRRLFHSGPMRSALAVSSDAIGASASNRIDAFYRVFPKQVDPGERKPSTLRWLIARMKDGKGVVTPRDVIFLLQTAIERRITECTSSPGDVATSLITGSALKQGLLRLSDHRCKTYLAAEFPHLMPHINKFRGQRATHLATSMEAMLGMSWKQIADDLMAVGFLGPVRKKGEDAWVVPHLYRSGLDIKQGTAI